MQPPLAPNRPAEVTMETSQIPDCACLSSTSSGGEMGWEDSPEGAPPALAVGHTYLFSFLGQIWLWERLSFTGLMQRQEVEAGGRGGVFMHSEFEQRESCSSSGSLFSFLEIEGERCSSRIPDGLCCPWLTLVGSSEHPSPHLAEMWGGGCRGEWVLCLGSPQPWCPSQAEAELCGFGLLCSSSSPSLGPSLSALRPCCLSPAAEHPELLSLASVEA